MGLVMSSSVSSSDLSSLISELGNIKIETISKTFQASEEFVSRKRRVLKPCPKKDLRYILGSSSFETLSEKRFKVHFGFYCR